MQFSRLVVLSGLSPITRSTTWNLECKAPCQHVRELGSYGLYLQANASAADLWTAGWQNYWFYNDLDFTIGSAARVWSTYTNVQPRSSILESIRDKNMVWGVSEASGVFLFLKKKPSSWKTRFVSDFLSIFIDVHSFLLILMDFNEFRGLEGV